MMPDRPGADGGGRRREATDLYATVLEVVKRHRGAARITRVSYGAGMPVDRLRILLDRLLELGLLSSEELDGRPAFDITARGQEFLDTYWKMRGYIEGLEMPPERRPTRARRAVDPALAEPDAATSDASAGRAR
jgi:predicted transcriptional regulator